MSVFEGYGAFYVVLSGAETFKPVNNYYIDFHSTEQVSIALGKRGFTYILFLFLRENIHCGYSLEASCRVSPNEYLNVYPVSRK